MKKKQTITSPNKVQIKESNMIAKLGPQEAIMSDTSIRNHLSQEQVPYSSKQTLKNREYERTMQKNKSPGASLKGSLQSPRSKTDVSKTANVRDSTRTITASSHQGNTGNIPQGTIERAEVSLTQVEYQPQFRQFASDRQVENAGTLRQTEHSFSNGDHLVGFHNGRNIQGYGVYTYTNQGVHYRGHFKQGKQHGEGSLYRITEGGQQPELIYDGEWMNGMKQGHGIYHYFKDTVYDGNWYQNKKEGYGIFRSPEGEYKGEWKDDKKQGEGTLQLKTGVTMKGKWQNDQLVEGQVHYSNGDSYEGDFKNFNRDGYGTYNYANKSSYRGYWANDQKSGTGEVKFFNGDIFYGNFDNNSREGEDCKYVWHSGEQIVGATFREDVPVRGRIRLPTEGEYEFSLP